MGLFSPLVIPVYPRIAHSDSDYGLERFMGNLSGPVAGDLFVVERGCFMKIHCHYRTSAPPPLEDIISLLPHLLHHLPHHPPYNPPRRYLRYHPDFHPTPRRDLWDQ